MATGKKKQTKKAGRRSAKPAKRAAKRAAKKVPKPAAARKAARPKKRAATKVPKRAAAKKAAKRTGAGLPKHDPPPVCGCKHGDEKVVGKRRFRLNPFTGLAHVVDGPPLPGPSGLGRRERDQIRAALPPRGDGVEKLLGWQLTDDKWVEGRTNTDKTENRDRRCTTDRAPEVVFSMGLPGSGKSTTLKKLGILDTHLAIDPDEIAKHLPGYDPLRPELTYPESQRIAAEKWHRALVSGAGRYVLDGTGTDPMNMIRRLREARRAGFSVRVIYVRTSLQTALARNRSRERQVPESVVRQKATEIDNSVATLQDEADCFQQVNND